ncbi:MAG: hypothetical protein K0R38_2746 [Polyangiaceae bacterium]|jgi:hypothetical protein|nr:hypothetical protein [Polyangiaceae bacterium]
MRRAPRRLLPANAERLLAALLTFFILSVAFAAPARVVVEIDVAAERAVDARSARRLIALELADVALPRQNAGRPAELFVRVLGREGGSLRLELWERGEFHGARALNGAGENPQLFARRVALAAAELGRRLARKREAALQRDARLKLAREERERRRREGTQDGPVALRSELGFAFVPGRLWLGGSKVTSELTLRGALRLDIGAEGWAGHLRAVGGSALYGVSLGPAYRVSLSPSVDWDVAARASVLSLQVPASRSLDAIPGQQGSWTALVALSTRLELRLTRQVRAHLGLEGGGLLRAVSYVGRAGNEDLRGPWASAALGLVVTPP